MTNAELFAEAVHLNTQQPHHTAIQIYAGSKHFQAPNGDLYHWGDFILEIPLTEDLKTYNFKNIPEEHIIEVGIEHCAEEWFEESFSHMELSSIGFYSIKFVTEDEEGEVSMDDPLTHGYWAYRNNPKTPLGV